MEERKKGRNEKGNRGMKEKKKKYGRRQEGTKEQREQGKN